MPAFAYPIKVNYNRETVRKEHTKTLDDRALTTKTLSAIVGDNPFSIREQDELFSIGYEISWTTTRPETDQEMQDRIKRGEEYNHKREEFLKRNR